MTGGENGPELINMTSSGGMATSSSLMQPDPFVDVTLQRNMGGSVATLNNGGGVASSIATLPRSSLARRGENHVHTHGHSHHGTLLKRSVDELRMNTSSPSGAVIVTSASVGGGTSATPDHLHHHDPSRDTLRRVHFDKNTPGAGSNGSNSTEVSMNPMTSSVQGNVMTAVTPPVPPHNPAVPSHKIPVTTADMAKSLSPPPVELPGTIKDVREKYSTSSVVKTPKESSPSAKVNNAEGDNSGAENSPSKNVNSG